ncbi:MAG: cobalamin-binding protein [Pseudomonadales bacterium]
MKHPVLGGAPLMFFWLLATPSLAEISVTDLAGRIVTLDSPAQRIIALAPHIVENTFSAGAGNRLVGVVSYSNYPEAAQHITRVGSHQSWSLEAIVKLKPDLVLMWSSGNGMKTLPALERLGLKVYVSEPRNLQDIPATIRAIGELAGTQASSEPEAQRVEQELAQLAAQYRAAKPVSVFYQVWNKPLQTLNGDHLISDIIELCGGRNAFGDAASLAPKINIESVLERDPQTIVASGMGAARPEWLDEWKAYPSLTAVRDNALFFVNPDHIQRPTARVLLGSRVLCEQLASVR